jgi:hypothetical protein
MKIFISSVLISLLVSDGCEKNATKSKEELLTEHTWKLEEITQVENNAQIYYKRGGESNTHNFDNDKLTFLTNGTGTYSPTPEQAFDITWRFTNVQKTVMDIVITFSPSLITSLRCSKLELTRNSFSCITNFRNASNQPVRGTVYRTPL